MLPENGAQRVQVVVSPPKSGLASFEVYGIAAGLEGHATLQATGSVRPGAPAAAAVAGEPASPAQIQERCAESVSAAEHYQAMRQHGLEYGPRFQGIEQIWRRDGEALARVRLPDELRADAAAHRVHPALLDACFQVLAAALPRGAEAEDRATAYLPVSVAHVHLDGDLAGLVTAWSHAVLHEPAAGGEGVLQGDVFLLDEGGRVAVAARGLRVQRLENAPSEAARRAPEDWLYEVRWERAALAPATNGAGAPGTWLLLADRQGVAEDLRVRLEAKGDTCLLAPESDGDDAGRYTEIVTKALEGPAPLRGVVHLWSLDTPPSDVGTSTSPGAAVERACLSALRLTQALAAAGGRQKPRLWLVTRAAQPVSPDQGGVSASQAALWGLGRTIAHEHPELRCTNVDLGTGPAPGEQRALFDELSSNGSEREVALRGDERFVSRLARFDPAQAPSPAAADGAAGVDAEENLTLTMPAPGILDNLSLRRVARPRPGPGQVEIRVHAAGLNFLDVLGALGLRPDAAAGSLQLGAECAGEVSAVGEGVEGFAEGDAVVAIAPASFSAFVVTAAALVAHKPAGLAPTEMPQPCPSPSSPPTTPCGTSAGCAGASAS